MHVHRLLILAASLAVSGLIAVAKGNLIQMPITAPTGVAASIAFVGATDLSNNAGAGSLTGAVTVANDDAGEMLVVAINGDVIGGADDITSVTYNSVAMTLAGKQTTAANPVRIQYLYYLMHPTVGTHNVVISTSGSHYLLAVAAEYSGVAASPVDGAAATSSGAGAYPTPLTTNITTTSDNDWVLLVWGDQGIPAASTGTVLRVATNTYSNPTLFDSGGPLTPAGSKSLTTTETGGVCTASCNTQHLLVAFKPSGTPYVPPTSVWSVSDKDSAIGITTTTIANDTATRDVSASAFKAVRGTKSYAVTSVNKRVLTYLVAATDPGVTGWIGGVGTAAATLSYPGGSNYGWGTQTGTGAADYINGSPIGSGCTSYHTWATGETVWLAIDFNTGKVFCGTSCTSWFNSGNPDAGTGQIATLSSGATYLPMWGGLASPAKAVINTKPTLSGCSNIAGFSQWG